MKQRIALFVGVVALTLTLNSSAMADQVNPHGDYNQACDACHSTQNWTPLKTILQFNHSETTFPLNGQHRSVNCLSCHKSLVFSEAPTDCYACHTDVHDGELGNSCTECHSTTSWGNQAEWLRRHQQTRFPLVGEHSGVDCQACHANDRYANTPLECSGCHIEDFNRTEDPVHLDAMFSSDCRSCHKPRHNNWQDAEYEHPQSFLLEQGHDVDNCNSCHAVTYTDTPNDCWSCHDQDYLGVEDPVHSIETFSHECDDCHDIAGWKDGEFDHNLSSFQLTGAHVSTNCNECHSQGYTGTLSGCWDCHAPDYGTSANPPHAAGGYDHECNTCHSTEGWAPASFDHDLSDFTLTGAHITVECLECHTDGVYAGIPSQCYDCHDDDYGGTDDPDHAAAQIDHDCSQCHTTASWSPSTFDHAATAFPLTGAHIAANCQQCHIDGKFAGTPLECYGCHASDFERVADPDHSANNYSHLCQVCHSTSAWNPASIDHDQTGFPLDGAHAALECLACHAGGFASTSSECYSCHRQAYETVADPNHVSGNYDHNCAVCHTTAAWVPAGFDHDVTDFPLDGAHLRTDCVSCHQNGYDGTPTECYACHRSDFDNVSDPNHVTGDYSHECATCHSTDGWTPAQFNHDRTDFPLDGAHLRTDCVSCHRNGYDGTSTECYACHQDDFDNVIDPNHVAGDYSHECMICHSTEGWTPAQFNHDQTDFPLDGAHLRTDCVSCHRNGYSGTPTNCFACHEDNFNDADDPDHEGGRFNHDCTQCHNTAAWSPSTFDHDQTNYPLVGAHREVGCQSCHVNGRFEGTPMDCFSCHEGDFNDAGDPDHAGNSFNHDCIICHSMNGWSPATFDHDDTDFPLQGAHASVQCASCHVNGQYAGTPTDCFSCHESDYNDVDDPDHAGGNFDHDCKVCHTLEGWSPAVFDHGNTDFPLRGAHTRVECAECHVAGQYNGLPTDCFFCHEDDYNDVDDPDHRNAGFPRDCAECHNENGWGDADFDHDGQYFPIYRGNHREGREWDSCSECHPNPNDFGEFTCIDCHEHERDRMDREHREVNNYRYDSQACLQCHPDGREDDFWHNVPPVRKAQ